jgi:hypothetical protein
MSTFININKKLKIFLIILYYLIITIKLVLNIPYIILHIGIVGKVYKFIDERSFILKRFHFRTPFLRQNKLFAIARKTYFSKYSIYNLIKKYYVFNKKSISKSNLVFYKKYMTRIYQYIDIQLSNMYIALVRVISRPKFPLWLYHFFLFYINYRCHKKIQKTILTPIMTTLNNISTFLQMWTK